MKGHIKQRSKGSWSIVIDVGKDPETGKRHQQWHTVKGTKRNAQRILHEILVTMEKGMYVKPNSDARTLIGSLRIICRCATNS